MTGETSKSFSITGMVRHHLGSAKAALLRTPYWVWPVPLILVVCILLIRQSPLGWYTEKHVQELVAPAVIGLTAVMALAVHRWMRAFFTLLLACFAGALFIRELHYFGTGKLLYGSVFLLVWWASSRRDELHDFLKWPSIRGLLGAAVWTYFTTKLFDRHYFSFLPDYTSWNNNVEETLETSGHALVLALVVVTLRIGSLQNKPGAKVRPENTGSA